MSVKTIILMTQTILFFGVVVSPVMADDANHFELKEGGGKWEIIYDKTDMVGNSQLIYKENSIKKSFTGSDIRKENSPDLGEIVSVTLSSGRHGDPTTLAIFLPRVIVDIGKEKKVSTKAITVFHKSDLTDNLKGQRDIYTVAHLTGKARSVVP